MNRKNFIKAADLVSAGISIYPASGLNNFQSIEPTKAQKSWMELKYGMFIHFGPKTLRKSKFNGGFKPSNLHFSNLDCKQWAKVAKNAGMKYAVLTTKHHDGFCMWPSKYTDFCVKNSSQKRDIVGEFVTAFQAEGIKTGLYYSNWDLNCPFYDDDDRYAEYMQNQIRELAESYGPVVEWWFDGAWDKDHPDRNWMFNPAWETDPDSGYTPGTRYQWKELYQLIHQLQPDSIVMNNSSSDRPGQVRYFPIDARTAEHYDYVFKGEFRKPPKHLLFKKPDGEQVFLPLEFAATLPPNWFWTEDPIRHPSIATIVDWYKRARNMNANLLLNVGPDNIGLIPKYNQEYLNEAWKIICDCNL